MQPLPLVDYFGVAALKLALNVSFGISDHGLPIAPKNVRGVVL
jgi:hypothetical protein